MWIVRNQYLALIENLSRDLIGECGEGVLALHLTYNEFGRGDVGIPADRGALSLECGICPDDGKGNSRRMPPFYPEALARCRSGYQPVNFIAPTSATIVINTPTRDGSDGTSSMMRSALTNAMNATAHTALMT